MKTAVEWLSEKYDYAYWMVKRDEISPALAEEWKKHYLEQAKEMEKEQIKEAYCMGDDNIGAEQYYNETFKSE
jgi:hypothetical protein